MLVGAGFCWLPVQHNPAAMDQLLGHELFGVM